MRDLLLLGGVGFMLVWALKRPHVGVLLWGWTALLVPNTFVYGFATVVPFNKIAAGLTLFVWLVSREPKRLPANATIVLLVLFGFWGTVSAFTSISQSDTVLIEWEKFIKVIVFALVVAGIMTTRERIVALLYAIFLSLGFHGIREGAKVLVTAGHHHVFGPAGSVIGDNNHFALAMVALLPIMFYLYRQTEHRMLRLMLAGSSLLVVLSIMGTYSRGGLLGIMAVGAYAFMHSKKKLRYALAVVPILIAAIIFAPAKWSERMDTIKVADQDNSFMGRVIAWKQSTLIAMDHPIFGGGFHAVQDRSVWMDYRNKFSSLDFIPTDDPDPFASHAAHSIYFETLGDLGFVGFGIFIAILASAWRNSAVVIRVASDRPEWRWTIELATSLRYSLLAYVVSGAALSMAYFDYMYMIFALLVVLRTMVTQPQAGGAAPKPIAQAAAA